MHGYDSWFSASIHIRFKFPIFSILWCHGHVFFRPKMCLFLVRVPRLEHYFKPSVCSCCFSFEETIILWCCVAHTTCPTYSDLIAIAKIKWRSQTRRNIVLSCRPRIHRRCAVNLSFAQLLVPWPAICPKMAAYRWHWLNYRIIVRQIARHQESASYFRRLPPAGG